VNTMHTCAYLVFQAGKASLKASPNGINAYFRQGELVYVQYQCTFQTRQGSLRPDSRHFLDKES